MQNLDDSTDDSKLEDISKLYPRMNYNDIVALDKVFNEILKKKKQKLIDSNQFQIICLDLFPHIKREILSNDSESRDDVLNFLKQLYTYGDGSSNEEMDFNNLVNIIHITKFGTLVEQFNLCMNLMAEKNIEKDQFYIVLKHLFLISYEGEFNLEKKKNLIFSYAEEIFGNASILPIQQVSEKVFFGQTNLEDFWTQLYIHN